MKTSFHGVLEAKKPAEFLALLGSRLAGVGFVKLSEEQRGSTVLPVRQIGLPFHDLHKLGDAANGATQVLSRLLTWAKSHRKVIVLGLAGIGTVGALAYSASFFMPRSVSFSYGSTNCFFNPVILPKTVAQETGSSYSVKLVPAITVGGYPLYSQSTCVSQDTKPAEHTTEKLQLAPLGNSLFKKSVHVASGNFPRLSAQINPDNRVPAHRPLVFTVEGGDQVFDYRLNSGGHQVECAKHLESVACQLAPLKLVQGKAYELKLERTFRGEIVGEVFSQSITTIEPVTVAASSIAAGSTLFDKRTGLTLELNKPVISIDNLRLETVTSAGRQNIPVSFEHKDKTIVITFAEELPRETSFELIIDQVEAADQSRLEQAYVLPFASSGGPKVAGISIGSYKIQPGASFAVSFDVGLKGDQDFSKFIRVEAGGQPVGSTVKLSGRSLVVSPAAIGRCTSFTVVVAAGLISEHGVGDGSAWQYGSRTICQEVFGIGTSVNGRSITGYRFGGGASKIIFVGTTHGDEKSSTYTLNSLIDYLESNPGAVPAHRTVIIIPNLNPDGYAANRRTNARNVDLNRNFPSNSWKAGVTMPSGEYLPEGGGSAPLSEPESSALASYVLGQSPRLVLTYHSKGGMVIANESGDSYDLALAYGQKSGLWARKNSELGTTFNYDTTGAFEDWLHDKYSIPALLIELWSDTSNEFSKQRSAMLHMIALP